VANDVRNDIVSVERARLDYGVVVDPVTFAVDLLTYDRERAARSATLSAVSD
jgi:hypothetical protein